MAVGGEEALCAIYEPSLIEVDQQSLPQSGQPEIRQYLHFMDRKRPIDAFDLNQQLAVNDEIGAVGGPKLHTTIDKAHGDLLRDVDSHALKFAHRALLVHGFEESRAQGAMNGDRTADDLTNERRFQQWHTQDTAKADPERVRKTSHVSNGLCSFCEGAGSATLPNLQHVLRVMIHS